MINILKWEGIKRFHQIKWVLLFYIFLLIGLSLIPVQKNISSAYNSILALCSLFLTLGSLFFCLVYPIMNMVVDFINEYYIMERISGQSYIKVLISKLLLNFCSFFIGSGIAYFGAGIMKRFTTETITFFVVDLKVPYSLIMFSMVVIFPIIVLFSFLLASTIKILKHHRFLGTLIFIAAFYGICYLLGFIPNDILNIAVIPVILMAGVGSCILAVKKYEPK